MVSPLQIGCASQAVVAASAATIEVAANAPGGIVGQDGGRRSRKWPEYRVGRQLVKEENRRHAPGDAAMEE
jgi:hypothetical protein